MIDELHLKQVLKDEKNKHFNDLSRTIPRKILNHKEINLQPDLVLVIQGVRRCGKSTLLTQIAKKQNLSLEQCVFVNFEDPRLAESLNSNLLDLIVQMSRKDVSAKSKMVFFFDEIQNVELWEKWFHTALEHGIENKNYFVVTGSNSTLLGGKLSSALTGRHVTLELFPFDYEEFLSARPGADFLEYLEIGGFPRIVNKENSLDKDAGANLLREYFADIIERDVRRNLSLRSSLVLSQLAKSVFESTSSEVSYRNLAKVFGRSIETIRDYMEAIKAAYLIQSCSFFTFSERKRVVRPVKYYPIDLGMYGSIITRGGMDLGKRLETIVYYVLRKKYRDVFYWRGKGEVDFVVQDGNAILPFQVTLKPSERHLAAYEEFRKEFSKSEPLTIITDKNFLEKFS